VDELYPICFINENKCREAVGLGQIQTFETEVALRNMVIIAPFLKLQIFTPQQCFTVRFLRALEII